ncbi:DnaJ domain-containing protein [Pseudobutyrivibrio sp. YE44]|uniref:J domain-containing protein n=1 Tax=Pseudobutyrivibrio sp. YE44 TaxID=1520802 RepID=UPI00088FE609|nr:J domain-containing protein [Pseudobutyrivibrio sp. YE44]SDB47650.1 DnaJ domain-containing protein [Pseudobutyrivibrio sp. YE44]
MIKTRTEALRTLGLGPNASQEKIKMAYKDLVKRCHPDVTGSDDATLYNKIVEAYQFLCADAGQRPLTHSKVVGRTTSRYSSSNADYAAFQKKMEKQKKRKAQEFEQKQKDLSAMYEKQEADYKRAMEAIDAIRAARAIQSMIWANGLGKDNEDKKE